VADDVTAEIKNRNVEQALVDEIEEIQHSARSAVAVGEGMDSFELVVHHGQSDQRVNIFCLVDVAFPIRQFVAQ
jgi:hypothetical protein